MGCSSLYLVEYPGGVVVDGVVANRVEHVRLSEPVHDLHFLCSFRRKIHPPIGPQPGSTGFVFGANALKQARQQQRNGSRVEVIDSSSTHIVLMSFASYHAPYQAR